MVNGQPSPKRKLLCADFLSSVDNLSGNVDEWLSVNNPTLGFSAVSASRERNWVTRTCWYCVKILIGPCTILDKKGAKTFG